MTAQRPFQGSRFEQSTAAAFVAHQYRIHSLAGSITEPFTNRDDESEFVRIVEDVVWHNSTHGFPEEYLAIAVPHFELAWYTEDVLYQTKIHERQSGFDRMGHRYGISVVKERAQAPFVTTA